MDITLTNMIFSGFSQDGAAEYAQTLEIAKSQIAVLDSPGMLGAGVDVTYHVDCSTLVD